MPRIQGPSLGDIRARLVVDQLREELHEKHGERWQSEAARMLEVHPSSISKLVAGTRGAGKALREAMTSHLGLDANFFTRTDLGAQPRFRDHVTAPGEHVDRPDALGPAELEALIAERAEIAKRDPSRALDPRMIARARRAARSGGVHSRDGAEDLLRTIEREVRLEARGTSSQEHPDAPRTSDLRRRPRSR